MKFKIRNTDAESAEVYETCQQAYAQHLEAFNQTSNTHLWKFFRTDFFHDGRISSIKIRFDLRSVEMELSCPNIKAFQKDGAFEFKIADFTCSFQNVVRFAIEHDTPIEWPKSHGNYLYSEINTIIPPGLSAEKEFYSLIIEVDAGAVKPSWIELVFSQVRVFAREPAAFAIMESDPRFEVPTYRPESLPENPRPSA